jgi:uncharacterized protein (TIGR02186 family)
MMRFRLQLLLPLFLLLLSAVPLTHAVAREDIQSDLSSNEIAIESNFTGARIVVFGTIEDGRRSAEEAGIYDIVVVIRGPAKSLISRRKSRMFGVWMNSSSFAFEDVPSFYAVLSTRPLGDIAKPDVLAKRDIGFDSVLPVPEISAYQTVWEGEEARAFRNAVIRIKQREGNFIADDRGVIFISKTLFRATLDLPASVQDGQYSTDVFLFRSGRLLSLNQRKLTVQKVGFERLLYTAAFDYPLLYGLIAVLVAVVVGLSASAVFRRD